MAESLEQTVRRLAAERCEYCRMPQSASRFAHVLDHVIARQHYGKTELSNIALSCGRCNQHKGPNLAGLDPTTGQMTRLFHPRIDKWDEHFRYDGAVVIGLTAIGRATIAVLAMNRPLRIAIRQGLMAAGFAF